MKRPRKLLKKKKGKIEPSYRKKGWRILFLKPSFHRIRKSNRHSTGNKWTVVAGDAASRVRLSQSDIGLRALQALVSPPKKRIKKALHRIILRFK